MENKNYVWTKKAEDISTKRGLTIRKSGAIAVIDGVPLKEAPNICKIWVKNGLVEEVDYGR